VSIADVRSDWPDGLTRGRKRSFAKGDNTRKRS
jgi:hypothetical protein